ncbi:Golgin imh1 [Coemansia sp. BCRC 34301]|nr:Golgin imh1 [Coemansia sp. BCRC 34301]
MSETVDDPGTVPTANEEATLHLTSDKLQVGDVVSEGLLVRLGKLEKYEHKLAEVARVYRNLNTARKAVETVLKRLTPVQSIADVDELEAYLANLNTKSQYAGEQIGALTELDKANRAKIADLEAQLVGLRAADQERQTLAKDLDKLTKERKVVEGQLERTNQKLRLDVKALDTAKTELEAKLLQEASSVDALAHKLTSQLTSDESPADVSDLLRELQSLLAEKCGIANGLVSSVDEATARLSESHALELAQLKDILRKELAAGEDRLQTAVRESEATIAGLQHQLSVKKEEAGELTAERVADIIAAALANRLEITSEEAVAPPQGSKKKGKKKRKGTGASGLAPSPAPPAPDTADEDGEAVKASPRQVAQLVALIETSSHSSLADLRSRADQSMARVAELTADVQAKAQRIDELAAEAAEAAEADKAKTARCEALELELKAAGEECTGLARRIDELAAEAAEAAEAKAARCEALESELKTAADERTRLAQALAKAQGAAVRLEAQQAELKSQVTSLAADCEQARRRCDDLQAALERAATDHAQAAQRASGAESQLAQAAATVSGLEEHVRAVDADLANSRAQFADKSRAAAQALSQVQELQYALEKERRAGRAASEDAAKQAAAAHEGLAAAQAEADMQRARDRDAIDALRRKLDELDRETVDASRADRLEAQHAERQAELDAMRQSLQRAEDAQTALRVEADRLRDVERDLAAANEHLARVADERALAEQRWKRVHRDLKEELRRLQREKIPVSLLPTPADDAKTLDPPQSPSSSTQRSNSLTLASVSSLLRAATTANASASAVASRRGAARVQPPAPILESTEPATTTPNHALLHTRSVSNAASTASSSSSSSDALAGDSSATVNIEYLRNVLFRFFDDKDRRAQLVPVLSKLLRCKTDEIKHIQLLLQK